MQREAMRLMAVRWAGFSEADRSTLESRIINGPPRSLLPDNTEKREFQRFRDRAVFVRLSRIRDAGGRLTDRAIATLEEIQNRYPKWETGPGDRDDFTSWHWSSSGLQGDASALEGVDLPKILTRAQELSQDFENSDVWRIYVSKEPERCFEALALEARSGNWPQEFWTGFFWEAFSIGDGKSFNQRLFRRLFDLFLSAPRSVAKEWSPLLTHKFAQHHARWTDASAQEKLQIWDQLWHLALGRILEDEDQFHADDPVDRAGAEPGGELSQSLIQMLDDSRKKRGTGLPINLRKRFDLLIRTSDPQATFARIILGFYCHFLYLVDPDWTVENMVPLFDWQHPESLQIQQAYHFKGKVGPADFFGHIKAHVLAAFERRDWMHGSRENLSHHLVLAVMSRYRSDEPWNIAAGEAKKALRVGEPYVRDAAAWFLWRQLKDTANDKRSTTWRDIIKPTFVDLWPPDRDCQDSQSSYRLAEMALLAETAFPDALASIEPFLVPMAGDNGGLLLYQLQGGSLEQLQRFPSECLRLVGKVIVEDSPLHANMLRKVLNTLTSTDSALTNEPAFRRLDALARQRGF